MCFVLFIGLVSAYVCMCVHAFVYIHVCWSAFLSMCLSVFLFVCVCLSVCLSVCKCLSVCLSVRMHVTRIVYFILKDRRALVTGDKRVTKAQ